MKISFIITVSLMTSSIGAMQKSNLPSGINTPCEKSFEEYAEEIPNHNCLSKNNVTELVKLIATYKSLDKDDVARPELEERIKSLSEVPVS
jgi:hypothetical protein